TFFFFNNKFYKQRFGTLMGSLLGLLLFFNSLHMRLQSIKFYFFPKFHRININSLIITLLRNGYP
ncbi:hypothetical protein ALC56_11793, partial [Trachymyrmex septentrionalis]